MILNDISPIDGIIASRAKKEIDALDGAAPEAADPFAKPEGGMQLAAAGAADDIARQMDIGAWLKSASKATAASTTDILKNVTDMQARGGLTREQMDILLKTLTQEEEMAAQALGKGTLDLVGQAPPVPASINSLPGMPGQPKARGEVTGQISEAMKRQQQRGNSATPITPDGKPPETALNLQRHHPGAPAARPKLIEKYKDNPEELIRNVQNADDFAVLLEIIAKEENLHPTVPRTHNSIRADVPDYNAALKELQPFIKGEQKGLFNDRQLFAARSVLATLGDRGVVLARQIAAGDHSPGTLLAYERVIQSTTAITSVVKNQARETARALSQQRMIAGVLDTGSLEQLRSVVDMADSRGLINHAKMVAVQVDKNPNETHAQVMLSKLDDKFRKGVSAAAEYWKANILSGVSTHTVNMSSNALTQMWENAAVKPMAAAIGESRHALGKNVSDYYSGQAALVSNVTAYNSIKDAVHMSAEAFKQNGSAFYGNKVESGNDLLDVYKVMFGEQGGAAVHNVQTAPFRALTAEDELFKTLAYRTSLSEQALLGAQQKGLKGKAMWEEMGKLFNDPTAEMHTRASEYAKTVTFTSQDVGLFNAFRDSAKKLVQAHPVFEFLMPFINTPTNVANYGLENSAILGVLSPRLRDDIAAGGARMDLAMGRIAASSAMSLAIWQLYNAGIITGGGSGDYKLDQLAEHEGIPVYGLKLGDSHLTFNRLDPFASQVSVAVNWMERARYAKTEEEFQHAFLNSLIYLSDRTMDQPFLQGMSNLMSAIDDQGIKGEKFIAGYVPGLVPASAMTRDMARLMDPYQHPSNRDKYTQKGVANEAAYRLATTIPGMGVDMRRARYWDGTMKEPDAGRVVFALSPFKIHDLKEPDPATRELHRVMYVPREVPPEVTLGGISISLTELDRGKGMVYDAALVAIGEARKEAVTKLISSHGYKQLTDDTMDMEMRKKALRAAISEADTGALNKFIMGSGLKDALAEYEDDELSDTAVMIRDAGGFNKFYNEARRDYEGIIEDEGLEDSVRMKGKNFSTTSPDLALPKDWEQGDGELYFTGE